MTTAKPPSPVPHDINYAEHDDMLFTIDTHPSADILAAGNVDGKISLFSYAPGQECTVVRSFNHHKGNSCRVSQFSRSGKCLFSGCKKDSTLYVTDVETGRLVRRTKKAHSAPPYAMHTISENQLASGDEGGEIKLWDTRSWRSVLTLTENKDYISNMTTGNENRTLLVTRRLLLRKVASKMGENLVSFFTGDGSLVVVDLRQRKLEERSDCNESELLSLAVVKGGRKVVCGDGEGVLMIYNWGLWGDITDRYPGHPQSVDSLIAINDSVICTGCMDGVIRSVQVLPNQLLGTVGRHTEDFPVDSMCLTHDRAYLVTGSQDCCKFWPVEDIPKLKGSGKGTGVLGEGVGEEEGSWSKRRKRKRRHRQRATEEESGDEEEKRSVDDFFADL